MPTVQSGLLSMTADHEADWDERYTKYDGTPWSANFRGKSQTGGYAALQRLDEVANANLQQLSPGAWNSGFRSNFADRASRYTCDVMVWEGASNTATRVAVLVGPIRLHVRYSTTGWQTLYNPKSIDMHQINVYGDRQIRPIIPPAELAAAGWSISSPNANQRLVHLRAPYHSECYCAADVPNPNLVQTYWIECDYKLVPLDATGAAEIAAGQAQYLVLLQNDLIDPTILGPNRYFEWNGSSIVYVNSPWDPSTLGYMPAGAFDGPCSSAQLATTTTRTIVCAPVDPSTWSAGAPKPWAPRVGGVWREWEFPFPSSTAPYIWTPSQYASDPPPGYTSSGTPSPSPAPTPSPSPATTPTAGQQRVVRTMSVFGRNTGMVTYSLPSMPTAGRSLVLAIRDVQNPGQAVTAVSDNQGNVTSGGASRWVPAGPLAVDTSARVNLWVLPALQISNPSVPFTIAITMAGGSFAEGFLAEVDGPVDSASPWRVVTLGALQDPAASPYSVSTTGGDAATPRAGETAFTAFAYQVASGDAAIVPDTGFVAAETNSNANVTLAGASGYKTLTADGHITASWAYANLLAAKVRAIMAVLKNPSVGSAPSAFTVTKLNASLLSDTDYGTGQSIAYAYTGANPAAGSLLVALAAYHDPTEAVSATASDTATSPANTWTHLRQSTLYYGEQRFKAYLGYTVTDHSTGALITITVAAGANTAIYGGFLAIRGHDPTTPIRDVIAKRAWSGDINTGVRTARYVDIDIPATAKAGDLVVVSATLQDYGTPPADFGFSAAGTDTSGWTIDHSHINQTPSPPGLVTLRGRVDTDGAKTVRVSFTTSTGDWVFAATGIVVAAASTVVVPTPAPTPAPAPPPSSPAPSPNPAPTPVPLGVASVVTVSSAAITVTKTAYQMVLVRALDAAGAPVAGATLSASAGSGVTLQSTSAVTDTAGEAAFLFRGDTVGASSLTITG